MVILSYYIKNSEKNATIFIDKEIINSLDAMEFINHINAMDKDIKNVTVDLDSVMFVSSAGLGMILNAHIVLKRNDIKLKIINVSNSVKELFIMTKMDTVISVEYKED